MLGLKTSGSISAHTPIYRHNKHNIIKNNGLSESLRVTEHLGVTDKTEGLQDRRLWLGDDNMIDTKLLETCQANGLSFSISGANLIIKAKEKPREGLVQTSKENKEALIDLLQKSLAHNRTLKQMAI